MVKKLLPLFFIVFIWLIFSKPYFFDNKIPFPADFAVNHFSLWSAYPKFWQPIKNPAQPDVVSQIMPWKKLTTESLLNFQIPFWNPYSFSGTPHLANYQSAAFSITNLFYFIFNFNTAWALAVLVQPLFAGFFTYFFVKSLKKSEIAALISAISFMFCGFITTWMSYTTLSLAITFLPLALYSIEKYFHTKKSRFLILLSLSFPLSFFSGHFQISIYFSIFVFAYIIFKFYETKNKSGFLNVLLFSFFGILLSSPQILPSIELYFSAFRSSIFQKIESVPIKHLTTIIAPDFYGNPVTRNNFFGNYAEWNSFLGVIPFLLGIYSLFKKSKQIIFFFLMAFLALLFSINSPILDLFVGLKIPVLSTSALSRVLAIFSFSFAILAAFGFDQLVLDIKEKRIKKVFTWFMICSFIYLVLWTFVLGKFIDPKFYPVALKNLILPSILFAGLLFTVLISIVNRKFILFSAVFLLLLTTFDLLRFASKWQTFSPVEFTFPNTPIVSSLQSLDNTYRTVGAFGAEGNVYFHIPGTEGYDPLYINRYGQFLGTLNDGIIKPSFSKGVNLPTNAKYFPKVIDFMGIKYVLLKKQDINKVWAFPLKKFPDKFKLIYREEDYFIYENKEVYPRAFLVGNYEILNDDQKIMDRVLDKKFDLRESVIVEKEPNINKSDNFSGNTKILEYSPNKIKIETNSNNDAILVLSDNYYPGWRAKVNGNETEVLRANYTFRAVPIPKGESKIEFYYYSKVFKWGFYLSFISLISIFIIIIGKWYTTNIWKRRIKTVKPAIKSSAKIADGKRTKKKQPKSKMVN